MSVLPEFTAAAGSMQMSGVPLHLKGASWFGAEGAGRVPDGLWVHNASFYLGFLAQNGFNAVRLPFALDNVLSGHGPDTDMLKAVPAWWGKDYLDVLEHIIELAAGHGLLILLDLQRLKSTVWPDNGLWYSADVTLDGVKQVWDRMQARFCGHWNTLGADLLNEPHGAQWNEWASAATSLGDFVLSKCPRWLVFVEGVAHKGKSRQAEYFWGENLEDASKHSVNLKLPNKLVYSPHVSASQPIT